MNGKTMGVGVLALVFGVTTAFGVKTFLDAQASRPPQVVVEQAKTATVVVAKVRIPLGKTVTADDVTTKDWPADMVPAGATDDVAKVVNRAALATLVPNEPVLNEKLATGPRDDLASRLGTGMRAFTIHLPTVGSGVAGFILPGNKVDVLLTVSDLPSLKDSGPMTVTLLQGVEILAVDQQLEAPAANKTDPKELRSVTLAVTGTQAAKLALAGSKGTLNLALRNQSDGQGTVTDPVTLSDLQFLQEPPVGSTLNVAVTAAHAPAPLSTHLEVGMRAFTIRSSLWSGLAGLLLPGDNVDVLLTVTDQATAKEIGAVTVTLVQGVEVLAIDQLLEAPASNKTEPGNKSEPNAQHAVTLAVTPVQAARLALAETKGTLNLSLRGKADNAEAAAAPVTVADLEFPKAPLTVSEVPEPQPVVLQIRTLRGTQNGMVSVHPVERTERMSASRR